MIMLGQMELVCKGKDKTGQNWGGGVGREERPQKRQARDGRLGGFLGYPCCGPVRKRDLARVVVVVVVVVVLVVVGRLEGTWVPRYL